MSFTSIFGWPLKMFYELTQNYGIAVILFGILVNVVLFPFMAKSKKSMMRTTRLNPKMKALQEKYGKDQQRYQQEVAKLYKESGVNPMSGCIWTLIPFPLLFALYAVIRQPLSKMMVLGSDAITQLTDWVTKNAGYVAAESGRAAAYSEIQITDLVHQNWSAVTSALGDFGGKLMDINYRFLGMNLGDQPTFQLWKFDWTNSKVWLPALGLFLIPVISAGMSWLSMVISQKTNPQQQDPTAKKTNNTMMIFMPIMSLWICFSMPAAMGVYWIINSVCAIARDVFLTKVYTKMLDLEDLIRAEKNEARALEEAEEERARQREETERRRAAGETEINRNTSKKKIQASQKQQNDERRAEAAREERAQKRARLGIEEPEKPSSQVGNRRYARGRAYDPDRYGNPPAASADAESDYSDVSETGEN